MGAASGADGIRNGCARRRANYVMCNYNLCKLSEAQRSVQQFHRSLSQADLGILGLDEAHFQSLDEDLALMGLPEAQKDVIKEGTQRCNDYCPVAGSKDVRCHERFNQCKALSLIHI
eukprot:6416489-Amphidinium_carterae.1